MCSIFSLSLFCGKNLYVLERWIFKEINFIRNILYKHFTLHKLIHEVGIHLKESNYYKMNVVMNILIYSSVVITQSQVFHKCSHQCKKKKKRIDHTVWTWRNIYNNILKKGHFRKDYELNCLGKTKFTT